MNPLGESLTTRPIQTGWEFTVEKYLTGQFGFIYDRDLQFGNSSVWTRTWTRNDTPEPLLTLVIYTGHSFLSAAKFERYVQCDMKIKGTHVSASLSFSLTSITKLFFSSISAYLYLPPLVRSVHFSIEVFRWGVAIIATLSGINVMLGIVWLPHQPSHAFDDVSTPVFNRPLVIVIPSHILEGV
jgi:hypothetical protein